MFSMLNVLFSYSFPFLLLPHYIADYSQYSRSMIGMWCMLPFFIMMVLMGKPKTNDEEEDVENGNGLYYGEEEEVDGDEEDDEANNDNENKTKRVQHPCGSMWQRLEGGKGGGTTKFSCPHCKKTYTGSYIVCEEASLWVISG
jgi:hypothetical protein